MVEKVKEIASGDGHDVLGSTNTLDSKILDFERKEIGLSTRKALINVLTAAKPGPDSYEVWQLGMKMNDLGDLVDLSTDEKKLLLDKVRQTETYYPVIKGYLESILR